MAYLAHVDGTPATKASIVALITAEKISVNHVRDKAGDRGTSVHKALEDWCDTGTPPVPDIYPPEEEGYVRGLLAFLHDVGQVVDRDSIQAEVMVGSVVHGFAGRYDLRCNLLAPVEVTTRCYPKRQDKREIVPAGSVLLDLKTSGSVYESYKLQLAAYEGASIEGGYSATDYRAVVRVTDSGKYEFVVTDATFDEFLAVRATYEAVKRLK